MVKNPYNRQNKGRLPSDPPNYLGKVASEVWRKIVPFLESTKKVQRIDSLLVETYCTNYEIYKLAYEDIKENVSIANQANEVTSEVDEMAKSIVEEVRKKRF